MFYVHPSTVDIPPSKVHTSSFIGVWPDSITFLFRLENVVEIFINSYLELESS